MKNFQNNKGFTLIELIVVIAIIAILAAVAVPSYNRIQERAERSAAISNAQVIISCLNAHNAVADTDSNIESITGVMSGDEEITLSGVDTGGTPVPVIDSVDKFNACCENHISSMLLLDYEIALGYLEALSVDEFGIKEGYDHTKVGDAGDPTTT